MGRYATAQTPAPQDKGRGKEAVVLGPRTTGKAPSSSSHFGSSSSSSRRRSAAARERDEFARTAIPAGAPIPDVFELERAGCTPEVNWALCRSPVIPAGDVFHNSDAAILRQFSRSELDAASKAPVVRLRPEESKVAVQVVGVAEGALPASKFRELQSAARKHLSNQPVLFVDDASVGSGGHAAALTRVITNSADVALAAQAVFQRVAPVPVPQFAEALTLYVVPDLPGAP